MWYNIQVFVFLLLPQGLQKRVMASFHILAEKIVLNHFCKCFSVVLVCCCTKYYQSRAVDWSPSRTICIVYTAKFGWQKLSWGYSHQFLFITQVCAHLGACVVSAHIHLNCLHQYKMQCTTSRYRSVSHAAAAQCLVEQFLSALWNTIDSPRDFRKLRIKFPPRHFLHLITLSTAYNFHTTP